MSTQPWVIEAIRELAERVSELEKGAPVNESPASLAWNHCVATGGFPEADYGVYWRYQGRQGKDPLKLVLDYIEGFKS